MKTKKFMMVALTMLCAMTATTLFSSCGDDKDDTPQYVMYSISDYKKEVKISGQTMDYLWACTLQRNWLVRKSTAQQ